MINKYHVSTVTFLLHIVTTIRFFIKSSQEGRLDCPKYPENQLAHRFFVSGRGYGEEIRYFLSGGGMMINIVQTILRFALGCNPYRMNSRNLRCIQNVYFSCIL